MYKKRTFGKITILFPGTLKWFFNLYKMPTYKWVVDIGPLTIGKRK
jgi:hypothetical protein